MSKNPLWDFHCITQEEYLQKTKSEKEQLLSSYYVQMKNGEKQIICSIVSEFMSSFVSHFAVISFSVIKFSYMI